MSSGPRVVIPVSGVTDSNGNATIATPAITQWSTLTAFAKLGSANGTWTAFVSGSNTNPTNPVGEVVSNVVTAGPFDVAPNEYVVLSVSQAPPNTPITGTVFGIQNVDPNDLDARTMSATVSGTTLTVQAQSIIYQIPNIPPATSVPSAFGALVPSNIQSVAVIAKPGTGAASGDNFTNITLLGNVSNIPYISIGNVGSRLGELFEGDYDSSVFFNGIDTGFNLGYSTSAANVGDLSLVVLGSTSNFASIAQVENTEAAPLIVTQSGSPPLWLSPNFSPQVFSVALGTAGATSIISGFTGQNIYLFSINAVLSLAGSGAGAWETSGGIQIHNDTFQNGGPRSWPFFGNKLAIGQGLSFNVTAPLSGAFYEGSIVYSRG